ncbi:MAG: DUF4150 domain-containing protein, partial [Planctomycetes bacterium]|nr:DUF4150 domain-containing protein [Planctomycetota bacterium]
MSDRATHKTGEAIVISRTPDVCKTPMGSSMVPVPYPIVAQFDAAQQVASKTNFEGDPAFHMGSHLPRVQGDEAGVGGGVVSGVNMGCCKPVEHSGTLRTEGEWVVRHGDLMDMNCAGPSGTGNTQGKIVFVACLKQSRVNADGSIEYAGERRSVDEAGNETVERVQVTQSADGRIEQATYGEATRDAAGNVSVQETSVAFDGEGRLSEQSFVSAEQRAPMNNDPRGPVLGSDAIGKPTGDGRVYLGDGMYAPVGGAPRAAGIAVMDPASVDPRADADYQQAVDEVAVAQAEVDAITAEQVLDATQMTIDLAGIADPTPLSDGVSAAISVARGDWLGAGLSIVSMVPYFGDALAKPAKAAKAAAKGTKLAAKLEKAAAKLKKAKEALEAAGKKIGKKLGKGGGSGSDGGLIKRGGGGGGRGPRG